jgi:plastocyanin
MNLLAFAVATTALFGCSNNDDNGLVVVAPVDQLVSIQDQCDIASFNAAVGAGTCVKQGNTTFAAFTAELAATGQVAGWRFVPSVFTVRTGQAIAATNDGGEVHTFTRVVAFGGGVNPALNTASGNPVPAPECTALNGAGNIAPGTTFRTLPLVAIGTANYQCCIHPWMRAVATVTN